MARGRTSTSSARNGSEGNEVLRILDNCQRSSHVHAECATKLGEMVREGPEEALESIRVTVDKLLVIGKKEPSVERLVRFISTICSTLPNDSKSCALGNETLESLLEYLLELTEAEDKAVRMRVAQLVGAILHNIPDDGQFLQDETWDKLETKITARLSDKAPAVRAQAVIALERLQDAAMCAEGKDPICDALTELLHNDSSAEVRKAVLSTVMVTKSSLPHIVQRTRDSKDDVRAVAFQVLGKRVHLKKLSIAQRATLLNDGLKDRSAAVRDACTKMLCEHWIGLVAGDPIELIRFLDVETYEETVLLALRTLFLQADQNGGSNTMLQKFNTYEFEDPTLALTSEGALFLFAKSEALLGQGREEALEALVPDVSSLSRVIESCMGKLRSNQHDEPALQKNQFVLTQLLKIAKLLDARHDVVGQQNVTSAIVKIANCKPVTSQLVFASCFELLRSFYNVEDEAGFCRQGASIIIDCLEPLEAGEHDNALVQAQEEAESRFNAEMEKIEEDLKLAVGKEDYEEAAAQKRKLVAAESAYEQEMNSLGPQVDQWRTERAAALTEALLTATRRPSLVPELASLKERILLPSIQQSDSQPLRRSALRALALLCQMDVGQSRLNLPVFLMVLDADEEEMATRIDALKAVFDLIMLWGLVEIVSFDDTLGEEEEAEAVDTLMFKLLGYMDCPDTDLRLVAAEGFAKLSVVGRLVDVRVLQCLLILYFHPSSEKDVRLRQCLAVCFPILAENTASGREAIQTLATPLLQAVVQPPEDSPLEEVPTEPVLQYLANLLSFSSIDVNVSFALSVLAELMADPSGLYCKALARLLLAIKLDNTSAAQASLLAEVTSRVKATPRLTDAVAKRQFSKWEQRVAEMEGSQVPCEDTDAISEWEETVALRSEGVEESEPRGTTEGTTSTARAPTRRRLGGKKQVAEAWDSGSDARSEE
eukprot:CAMPEP_0184543104 /NCGR_PEP_ID=MMETSP0199_2-20130426/2681_1 /TAXON_ID=1112570 /ORGANISM="Thraustochytrium sp., Strain LLF1b" /LENGTH=941 /DNA_ID=CAMNT_0026937087 /DNA_START=84 /DNA_END=2906 /DNA_ORIENTATION=+